MACSVAFSGYSTPSLSAVDSRRMSCSVQDNGVAEDCFESGRSPQRATSGNLIGIGSILLMSAAAIGGAFLLKRFMTPSVLRQVTNFGVKTASESATVEREIIGHAVPHAKFSPDNVYQFISSLAGKQAHGTIAHAAESTGWWGKFLDKVLGRKLIVQYGDDAANLINKVEVRRFWAPGLVKEMMARELPIGRTFPIIRLG